MADRGRDISPATGIKLKAPLADQSPDGSTDAGCTDESIQQTCRQSAAGQNINNVTSQVGDFNTSKRLEDNANGVGGDGFKEVTYKRKRQDTIVGKRTTDVGKLTAVEARSWIFLSRLHPSTTVEDVKEYAKNNGVTVLDCEQLEIRSHDISAFKMSVPKNLEAKVFSENTWPNNTIVRRYRRGANFQGVRATLKQT